MTEQPIHLAQIGQIAVPVTDLSRAVAFYRDILGMKFLFQVPNLAFFDCAGVRLMLDVPEDKSEHRSFVVYYKVDDIEGTYRTLSLRGVSFEDKPHMIAKMPDHELWMTFYRDADRNLLALMSEIRHP
jgi:methylmalonyl-CoA/ethylmalonyl-CoA epimerase